MLKKDVYLKIPAKKICKSPHPAAPHAATPAAGGHGIGAEWSGGACG